MRCICTDQAAYCWTTHLCHNAVLDAAKRHIVVTIQQRGSKQAGIIQAMNADALTKRIWASLPYR